jgi:mono/diheme cytochrome c family protein
MPFLFLVLALVPILGFCSEEGGAIFNDHCMACHQAGGVGASGLAPPLANPELWKNLGEHAQHYLYNIINAGMSGSLVSAGESYDGLIMPPRPELDETQIEALAHYILGDLNGLPCHVDHMAIKAARAHPLSHRSLMEMRNHAH